MGVRRDVALRRLVHDGDVYVAVDDLLVALTAAEMTWEAGGTDTGSLRLFARRLSAWARALTAT